jgi:acetyltransferase-like isoleucine patch superfamily enzyme
VERHRNIGLHRGVVVQRRGAFTVSEGGRLLVGEGTRIGSDAVIAVAREVVLGRDVLIAARCFISDHNHRFVDPHVPVIQEEVDTRKPVRIQDSAWVGTNILPGAHLGRNCVVGANA